MLKMPADSGAKVLLVCMPWAAPSQPSLSLGLIKAKLDACGIETDVAYLNLLYADIIGLDNYEAAKNRNVMASEWIFASHLGTEPKKTGYLEYLSGRGVGASELALWQRLRQSSDLFFRRCLEFVHWERYDVVGFTTSMMQTVSSLALAKQVKEAFPQIKIVLGGANCEGVMGKAIHRSFPQVDVVARGEVDEIVENLFRRLLNGDSLNDITGLCFRDNGESVSTPNSPLVTNLSDNPVPDYKHYFLQAEQFDILSRTRTFLMFESSRGCWWGEKSHCKFCALNGQGMNYRSKSVSRIVEELQTLKSRYGIDNFVAADNILDKHSVSDLSRALKQELPGAHIFYDIRAALKREEMELMSDSGINEVEAGLENLSTGVLRRMGKGTTGILNIRFLRRCREFGMEPLWNYLYGFPFESFEDYGDAGAKIDPWLHHLPAADVAFPLSLQRYSPYHNSPAENGIEVTGPMDDYQYFYGFDRDVLDDLAYYFKFRYLNNYDPDRTGLFLLNVVKNWQEANSAGARLDIELEGDESIVYDNRQKSPFTFRLDAVSTILLRFAESPVTLKKLGERLRCSAPRLYLRVKGIISARVAELENAGLLYCEDDRYLSLPVPKCPNFWIENVVTAPVKIDLPVLSGNAVGR